MYHLKFTNFASGPLEFQGHLGSVFARDSQVCSSLQRSATLCNALQRFLCVVSYQTVASLQSTRLPTTPILVDRMFLDDFLCVVMCCFVSAICSGNCDHIQCDFLSNHSESANVFEASSQGSVPFHIRCGFANSHSRLKQILPTRAARSRMYRVVPAVFAVGSGSPKCRNGASYQNV